MINFMRDWISLLLVVLAATFATANGVGAADDHDDVLSYAAVEKMEHVFEGVKNMAAFQEETWLGRDASGRQLLYHCDGPTETYYFDVFIRITPGPTDSTGVCSLADQVLLGNEFNQLLLQHGIGDAGPEDDVFYLAGVCPRPTINTTTVANRKLEHSLQQSPINGFIYSGGGGCRYCLYDNYDKRRNLRHLSNWFASSFAPETSATLEDAILTEIVPTYASCLGSAPVIDIELVQVGLDDLNLSCEADGTVIESLRTVSISDTPLIKHNCQQCVSLDFSKFADGTAIQKGDWIGTQFKQEHGLTITATGGYSPSSNARIFDTGDTECVNVDGSRDFGSPNKNCGDGVVGLGEGEGGQIGESGENCVPVGNVLIVQESNKECPDSSPQGGIIRFTWDSPVLLSDIGLMDVDEDKQGIRITYADNYTERFSYEGFGDNAVQRIIATKLNVVQVEVIFPGTGAVTEINFCGECLPFVGHDSDHHCLYSNDETMIEAQEVISFDDIESHVYWYNDPYIWFFDYELGGRVLTNHSDYLTKYLEQPPAPANPAYRAFTVPPEGDPIGITFEFDFYEIDCWSGEHLGIQLYGSRFQLGPFSMRKDEGHLEGADTFGNTWTVDSLDAPGYYGGDPNFKDQRHRVKMMVPRHYLDYFQRDDGSWEFLPRIWFEKQTARRIPIMMGLDNIKLTQIHSCHKKPS